MHIPLKRAICLNDLKKRLMKYDVKREVYDEIAKVIHSDKSPVGIDAKKTHILKVLCFNYVFSARNNYFREREVKY